MGASQGHGDVNTWVSQAQTHMNDAGNEEKSSISKLFDEVKKP